MCDSGDCFERCIIPSAVMLTLLHAAGSVTSSSGQLVQDFERFYTLFLLAGFFLLHCVPSKLPSFMTVNPSSLSMVPFNGSLSFCLQ